VPCPRCLHKVKLVSNIEKAEQEAKVRLDEA